MKRAISLVLAAITLIALFSACASEPPKSLSATQPSENTEPATVDEVAETPEPTAEPEDVTIEDTVLYDQDGITVTATGITSDGMIGSEIGVLVENNTERNISLTGSNFIVNGATMTGWLYIDVAAGKKSNGAIELYTSEFEKAGIDTIAYVSAPDAYIYDTDSYDTIAYSPFEISTSAAENVQQSFEADGDVVFEQDGITVTASYLNDTFYGNCVILFVENETGEDVIVEAENVSVNGFTIDAWLFDTVYTSTVRFSELDILSTGLEENGIESIDDITFSLNVMSASTYETITSSDEIQIFTTE